MEHKFYLLSDSPCELTKQEVDNTGVELFHFTYAEAGKPDGGMHGVDDLFESVSPQAFYDQIRKGACPMTSQPTQLEFEEKWLDCAERDKPTVYLSFTAALSGCYDGAVMALERVKEQLGRDDLPIYIVDTKLPSTPQNLFIHEAIHQRDAGLTAEEMVAWAEEARYYVQTMFMVDDLDALHRGGRMPKSVAKIGGALDVKPLLSIDLEGALTMSGMARGRKKGIKKMAANYEKLHRNDLYTPTLAIGNADCLADAEDLAQLVCASDPEVEPLISTIGPTIGCHVGPGMLSCCFWGPDRRKK